MNIHEVLFYSFINKECPTFMADKLIMLFRVAMMVFRNGNVSYNAVMICNTLMVDFFCRNHRILARGLGLEFIDNVLFRLIRNEGFWHFLNAGNVHLFYLDYRTKMMNLICHQLAKMYGHEHFHNIFRNLSPGMRGRQDLGKVFFLNSVTLSLLYMTICSSWLFIFLCKKIFRNSSYVLEKPNVCLG